MTYVPTLRAILVLCLLIVLVSGCETSRRPASDESEGRSATIEKRDDAIYVDRVGSMTTDELFDRFMSDQMPLNKVSFYADAVLSSGVPGAIDSVLVYADRYRSPSALNAVLRANRPELGMWLTTQESIPEFVDWSDIGRILAHNGWRDSAVAAVLMEQVRSNPEQRIRSATARAFMGMGTFDEIRTISLVRDTSRSNLFRGTATATLARFNVPEFNEKVRLALRDTSDVNLRLLTSLEVNDRHDLLPELHTLRAQVQGNKAGYVVTAVEELIADLEAKKARSVTPGAPLDYPNSTRTDSTSQ
jgi:hypothetical protein